MGSVSHWLKRFGRFAIVLGVLCAAWPLGDSLIKASRAATPRPEAAVVSANGGGPIPVGEIGATAALAYKGDGLNVTTTPAGAHLRSDFQKLAGDATRGGLWITSTIPGESAHLRLIADAVGREDSMATLPGSGTIRVQAQGASFTRPGLIEEYATNVNGVRQDFVVQRRPSGDGALHVGLSLTGAKATPARDGATLTLDGSGRRLAYSRLRVVDANGQELQAAIDVVADDRLIVRVTDDGAAYPVRIDPTFSDADWVSLNASIAGVTGANFGNRVYALAVDDDGNVYAGGTFVSAGSVAASRVAKWDGSEWSALGAGIGRPDIAGGEVLALVWANGSLYAGGAFATAGGAPASSIARWDGTAWSPLGTGVSGANGLVRSLAWSGGTLYVGGLFTTAGGAPAPGIARWNGSAWSGLGSGTAAGGFVGAMAVTASGELFAGGSFTSVGGVANTTNIAKWNGSAWSALGTGVNGQVMSLALDGSGTLFAAGAFTTAGSVATARIAKWNGTAWSGLGNGAGGAVNSIAVVGTDLYAGGQFNQVQNVTGSGTSNVAAANIAKWSITGSSWSAVGAGTNDVVRALALVGGQLIVGGNMNVVNGNVGVSYVAQLDTATGDWSALGTGSNGSVLAIALAGTDVYIGGNFTQWGTVGASRVARWNGSTWSALGSGTNNTVNALVWDGSGLYAGGSFTVAGGGSALRLARWNGSGWSAVVGGTNNVVNALARAPNGDLYVGGDFTQAGGLSCPRFATLRASTSAWSCAGGGTSGPVHALAGATDTGVYVGGNFTTPASHVARCNNGGGCTSLGTGTSHQVRALALNGTNLYVGGPFASAGGVANTGRIAVWNGTWSALGTGLQTSFDVNVHALAIMGSYVVIGGDFTAAGGTPANNIAAWDGATWLALGSGVNSRVSALAADPAGHVLVGGDFGIAGGAASPFLARLNASANHAPAADAGPDQALEAASPDGAEATLDASGTLDSDDDPLTYTWTRGATTVGTTPIVTVTAPFGSTTYTLTVSDGTVSSSDDVVITVQDTMPPSITVNTPPPGASYMQFEAVAAAYSCTDAASAVTACSGPVPNGANIDTSTAGIKTFTVTATDSLGHTSSATYNYTVVAPQPQTIAFAPPAGATYGDGTVAIGATASSGLAVTLTSNTTSVCTVSASTATIVAAGVCSITASQDGDLHYAAAAPVTQTFTVLAKSLTATLMAAGKVYDGTVSEPDAALSCSLPGVLASDAGNVTCTASSGSFDSPDAGLRTVSATVSLGGAAAVNYTLSAPVSTASATIAQAPSTTTVSCPISVVYTGTAQEVCTATATGAGGLSAPATVTYSGNVDAGTAIVTAEYAGDTNHAGSTATGGFAIARATQTITFAALGDLPFGAPDFAVSATSSSGLAVSFSASGACSISGDTVHLVTAGPCTVTASQGGNGNHEAAADESRTFMIRDLMPPAVVVPADITQEATGSAGAAVDFIVTAMDGVDGATAVSCGAQPLPVVPENTSTPVVSGDTFAIGATLVTCASADASGNAGTASFTVTVADTTDPTLSVADITATATDPAGIAVEYGPAANDAVSGVIAAVCTPTSNSVFAIGDTSVTCTASDAAGNSVSGLFTVHVLDGVAPVVTAPAVERTEATSSAGAVVTFAVTAHDNISGPLTPTCTPASGETFAVGVSNVHCFVADAAGNTAVADFTVAVTDTTAPALSLINVTATAATGTEASVIFTVSAVDIVDGAVTPVCSHASGAAYPIGTTTVTCTATDAHGNASSGTLAVTVIDGVSPTVSVPDNFTVEATSGAGAAATYAATAADNYDTALNPSCTPASGSTFPLGSTTVNCTAADAGGNTGTASFIVTVADTTAPALALPAPIEATSSSASGAAVTFTASSLDLVDGSRPVTCSPASGSTFPVGDTIVSCTTADSRGNAVAASFTVTVTLVSSNRIGQFVAFSRDYTWLRENATVVTGDIGANERRYHDHQPVSEDDGREDVTVRVGQNAEVLQSGSQVVGSTVVMANKSSVADVITNLLFNKRGTVRGTVTTSMTVPYLTLPAFPSVTPGAQMVSVAKKKTVSLPPGAYGDVTVENGGTLVLTGGLYQFRSLSVAQQGTILLSGPSEVRILRDLRTKAKSRIILDQNVPGLSAAQMVFYVAAADHDCTPDDPDDDGDNAGPVSVSIGQQSVVQAAIYAKNGTVWLRSKTKATGQFIGLHVRIGQRVTLTLASAFQ